MTPEKNRSDKSSEPLPENKEVVPAIQHKFVILFFVTFYNI